MALALVGIVAAVVALPILINGAGVILRGEYVSQRYFWRNAPKGVDAATLILGNPFHGLWGDAVRASYRVARDRPDRERRVAGHRAADPRGLGRPPPLARSGRPLLGGHGRHLLHLGARSAPAGVRRHDRHDPAADPAPLHSRSPPTPASPVARSSSSRSRSPCWAAIAISRSSEPGAAPLDRRRCDGGHHPARLPAGAISGRRGRSAGHLRDAARSAGARHGCWSCRSASATASSAAACSITARSPTR